MRDESKPVSLWSQYILGIVFTSLAFYRIKKLRRGLVYIILTNIIALGALIGFAMIDGVFYIMGIMIYLFLPIVLPLYFLINWTKEWNEKAQSLSDNNSEKQQ